MRIGFDAKRAFYNRSGLGNYSRSAVQLLMKYYPENEYLLYSPSVKKAIEFAGKEKALTITPERSIDRCFSSLWRSGKMWRRFESDQLNLFHGLSNELPRGIHNINIPAVVTIHDLIVMRHPEFYPFVDRKIYVSKFKYCSKHAHKIIATSEQTKKDIMQFLGVDENKIQVVYQACNPVFYDDVSVEEKMRVIQAYHLPKEYMLMVGTIEERKNLLNVVTAIDRKKIDVPLVVVGKATPYLKKVKDYISRHAVSNVFVHHNVPGEDLPALYQMADVFLYPSRFEGFGIPVLEALASGTPVITTEQGCFNEVGGPCSVYVDPYNPDSVGNAMEKVLSNKSLQDEMKTEGKAHAGKFKENVVAKNLMKVYNEILMH